MKELGYFILLTFIMQKLRKGSRIGPDDRVGKSLV